MAVKITMHYVTMKGLKVTFVKILKINPVLFIAEIAQSGIEPLT
jgi:hypothetical protein